MPPRADQQRRATLTSVAQAAGVSVPTVSKVVNGRVDVAPETRERVERLLVEHGYVARGPGGRQAVPQPRVLDLTFDELRNPNNLEIARGVTEEAQLTGIDVVVSTVPDDPLGAHWARRVVASGRHGLVLVTSQLSAQQQRHLTRAAMPLVLIDPVNVPADLVPSIGATNFSGGMAATEHLLSLGHRRIGMIGGRPDAVCSQARVAGHFSALATAGIEADPALLRHGFFRFEPAVRAALELLDLPEPPTAVFAASDGQALGVVEAARTRGLRVPEDLSVIGFDDALASQYTSPPLTTIRQPFADMGRAAVRSLLRLAAHQPLDSHRVELATSLVVRESTAPLRE
ncbi:LacI family DNA-binding transcriptional regulator [Streptomyces sp. NPDC001904]|uniref:LacI family DNA-binding transcriptional regulator n=1 Tax=Streptomyces sp. NPDC001904 TaxID=3154531 RepID=UPI003318261C